MQRLYEKTHFDMAYADIRMLDSFLFGRIAIGFASERCQFRKLGRMMMEWGGVGRAGGNGNPG